MSNIEQPVFIVGFPRSGTTYIQSLLARNENVMCIPETQFFVEIYGHKNSHMHKLKKRRLIINFLNRYILNNIGLNYDDWRQRFIKLREKKEFPETNLPVNSRIVKKRINAFHTYLCRQCQDRDRSHYIEKSPNHIFYIDEIKESLPNSKFVHIVREPASVLASVIDAMTKNDSWKNRYKNQKSILEAWIESAKITLNFGHQSDHHVVLYSELISNPIREKELIYDFIGVENSELNEKKYEKEVNELIYDNEIWKDSVKSRKKILPTDKSSLLKKDETEELMNIANDVYTRLIQIKRSA